MLKIDFLRFSFNKNMFILKKIFLMLWNEKIDSMISANVPAQLRHFFTKVFQRGCCFFEVALFLRCVQE